MTTTFGLFLTNQQPLDRDLVLALDEQLMMMRYIRDAGWNSVWAGQHYLPGEVTMLQPVPFLSRLAAEAGHLTVGLGILLLALRNPVDVAEEIASLDIVCRGNFIFGAGLGYRDEEYDAFAIPRGERVRRFETNLDILLRLWAGESVSVDLPWCRLDDARLTTLPVQRPRPPLWIAANNDKAVARAARLGDTWMINPHARIDTIREQLELFHATRAQEGLPAVSTMPAFKEIFCAKDRETAMEMAMPYLQEKYQTYASWGQDKALPGEESFDIPFAELEQSRFVIGSPDDCIAGLRPWRDELGVDHFILRTHWSGMPVEASMHSLRMLSEHVLPALRDDA
jgi:alkanesulfonate monooxygenase SsuD/methylene tetrahydromethanopterin reductase-like flavin-dependent oxidoreductase (luciferase family)